MPPLPTDLERRISEGGLLVEVLLPRTDAGVAAQALLVAVTWALLWLPARRAGVTQLWVGSLDFVIGLFALRAAH